MLVSMTGFGQAQIEEHAFVHAVEIRSVNNRYLKITIRLPEAYTAMEPLIERELRDRIRRGTVNVWLRLLPTASASTHRINLSAIRGYLEQLRTVTSADDADLLGPILSLPGVVEDCQGSQEVEERWPVVQRVLMTAFERFETMRREEGQAMRRELLELCQRISAMVEQIEVRTQGTAAGYRERLLERVRSALAGSGATVSEADLVREIALFADRIDISEEVTRLRSHLAQLNETIKSSESAGRKLDFLSQEMHRESNTIGAKANDAAVSQCVVDLKTQVERVRELVQNVE